MLTEPAPASNAVAPEAVPASIFIVPVLVETEAKLIVAVVVLAAVVNVTVPAFVVLASAVQDGVVPFIVTLAVEAVGTTKMSTREINTVDLTI